jgi:anti-sigma regulatory factor (Ser/Thr protein kinase)
VPEVYLHRITLTASAGGVRQALDEFEQFCQAQGLSDDLRRRFLVALDEILSNVSRHGRPSGHAVQVAFTVAADRLTVTIEDQGSPFNPLDAPRADTASPLEHRKAGGMGIELVRGLFENVRYEHTGAGNRLTITDRIVRDVDHS